MDVLLLAWLLIAFFHVGVPFFYIIWMRRIASRRPYDLRIDEGYEPTVTLIVPTYNEETTILGKLENISRVEYPKQKLEVVLIDGASTDRTIEVANGFLRRQTQLEARVIQEKARTGKGRALNHALEYSRGEAIAISDAECFWPPDALRNAVKYLADPIVGAVTGVHVIINPEQTQATKTEATYRDVYRALRIGESKLHSTPLFEGELALFRREYLDGFDENVGADDVAAALAIIRKGYRAVAASDVKFYEPTPHSWREKIRQKTRRGLHIIQAFIANGDQLFKRNYFSSLILPMEIYLYIVNPIFWLTLILATVFLAFAHLDLLVIVAISLLLCLVHPATRNLLSTYLVNNVIMTLALFQHLLGKKQLAWVKIEETRAGYSPGSEKSIGRASTDSNDAHFTEGVTR